MKKNYYDIHSRITTIAMFFIFASVHCSAQNFGQTFLNGLVQGVNNMVPQQNRQ